MRRARERETLSARYESTIRRSSDAFVAPWNDRRRALVPRGVECARTSPIVLSNALSVVRLSGDHTLYARMLCIVSKVDLGARAGARGRERERELTGYDYNATTRHTTDDA